METLTGTVESLMFVNEETGFVVARVTPEKGDDQVVVGSLLSVNVGEHLRMGGFWENHATYGRRFKILNYEVVLPATLTGIKKYLGSGLVKGIGPVFAERIVNHFGLEALEIIEERSEELLQVPGLGKKRVDAIRTAWQEQREIKNLMIFLQSHGVHTHLGVKIYKTYQNEAVNVIRENPFRLAEEVWGIGFKTADKIAQNLGMPPDAIGRLRSGVEYSLNRKSEEGHVYVPREELLASAVELLGVEQEVLPPVLETLVSEKRVILDGEKVYLAPFYYAELGVANRLKALMATPPLPYNPTMLQNALKDIERTLSITFAEHQREAVLDSLKHSVLILTGGPGTGKTTTVRGILALYQRLGMRVGLAAPTGRAAKRMTEVTGVEAKTIHRLLAFSPSENAFTHNTENPLPLDALIVDEVSMVDTVLMNHLLKAVPLEAHVVFVGDVDQLPSVGAGNVLRDLIASKVVPVVALTQIFRQAQQSLIVTNAHRINGGEMPIARGSPDRDFFLLEEEEPETACQMILDLCAARLPKHYGFDPLRYIQVLSPMRRGVLGADNLNRRLQETLNGKGQLLPHGGRAFRVGDKVMQLVNNYDREVFNGDVGFITGVLPEEGALLIQFPERSVAYDLADLSELTLAYGMTVHKSQGNEYPCVVIPFHTQHYLMLQRNLLYTAVTRAKRLVVLVGTRRAVGMAVSNRNVAPRYTSLGERLVGEIALPGARTLFTM